MYDTAHRHEIRTKLWKLAKTGLASSPEVSYVTGVGGNGKSHNLALFVQQAREAGAVVAYIHDMQLWLNNALVLIHELKFAVEQWNATHGKDHPIKIPKGMQKLLRLNVAEGARRTTDFTVLEATVALRSTCSAKGVPIIIVIDQDNRLHKLMTPPDPKYFVYNHMITAMQPHLIVLGASANNEGWDRRNWPNRIEHYPEAVPEEWLAELFPKTQARRDIAGMLSTDFNNYPLMVGMAENALVKAKDGRAVARSEVLFQLGNAVLEKINNFKIPDPIRFVQTTTKYLDTGLLIDENAELCYDFNHAYVEKTDAPLGEVERRLKSIFHFAKVKLHSKMSKMSSPSYGEAALNLPDPQKYETFFALGAKKVLTSAGATFLTAFLQKAYLQPHEVRFAKEFQYSLFKNTDKGQFFDFLLMTSLREEHLTLLTFYQLTCNAEHSQSHRSIVSSRQSYLGNDRGANTTLARCVESVRGIVGGAVRTYFIYISPKESLQLVSSDGMRTDTNTWNIVRKAYQRLEISLLSEALKSSKPVIREERQDDPAKAQGEATPQGFDGVYHFGDVDEMTIQNIGLECALAALRADRK